MSVDAMDPALRGKKALVTGGGTEVGRAIARALAQAGVDVALAGENPDPHVIDEIESLGVKGLPLAADVTREDEVARMVAEAIQGLGGLDLFVNNAAVRWDEPAAKVTAEGWFDSLNANLSTCAWACREASRHFVQQHSGGILIVGSVATWRALPLGAAHRAAGAAMKAYMEVLAMELAPHGLRVNMLTPGLCPEDLGPSALLLLSDRLSPSTTGCELVVDGGQTKKPLPCCSDREAWRVNANGPAEKPPARTGTVIQAHEVAPFSPEGSEQDFQSRLLVDDESVGSENLVVNYFTLQPGRSTYPGTHRPPYDEIYYVLRGSGVLTLAETDRHEMTADTLAFIPADTVHQLENSGTEPLDMLTMMAHLPEPGANTLYDERKERWGTSFRLASPDSEATSAS